MRSIVLLGLALLLAGCNKGAGGGRAERQESDSLYGAELPRPRPKPAVVLTTMQGAPFDLQRETNGFVTLVFFGYTHCPDICPLHMANLATVIGKLRPEIARQIKVVFVTTDPERDTPERLRTWLGGFSPDFIGLTGTTEELAAAAQAVGVPPAVKERLPGDTTYYVGHAAQVLAYTRDNLLRAMYPSGTRQADWAHDLPLLVNRWSGP